MRTPYEYRDSADISTITRRASAMRSAYIAHGVKKLVIKVKAVIAALTAKMHHMGHHAHTGA